MKLLFETKKACKYLHHLQNKSTISKSVAT